jgi:HD-like signal output (HDOD) protein
MKKRVCFAGFLDEQLEMLRSVESMTGAAGTWECYFMASAEQVLEGMTQAPFDVLVANMRLPGTNGAALLQQVGQMHPKTLRFILGDVADQELIMNCIGGTHQFIAGPCKPPALLSVIQRSLALDAWLSTDALRKIATQLRRLPSLPSTYFEVLKQVESPNATVQNIGEVISRDPAVTARLLQVVNSAAFALHEKVTDPVDAVSLLGVEMVKSLVLCLQVFSQNDDARRAGLSLDQLWDHSASVAKTAREIMLLQTRDARYANDAFTAGLLHDVGRIVIASNLPDQYASVVAKARETHRLMHEEEVSQLGVSHAQVGAYLLGVWGMPAPLVEAVALHHVPTQAFTREFSLLTAVHVADVLVHEMEPRLDGLASPQLDMLHLKTLNLEDKLEVWRKAITGVGTERVSGHDSEPETRQALEERETSIIRPGAPARVGQRRRASWLPWLLVPAAAAAAVVGGMLWFNGSAPNTPLQVQARTKPEAEPAPVPASSLTAAPITAPAATLPQKAALTDATAPSNTVSPPAMPLSLAHEDAAKPLISTNPAPVVAPARTPLDSVKIQAVFYRTEHPVAMINGRTVSQGDRFDGMQVVAIDRTRVTLSAGGVVRTFQVK